MQKYYIWERYTSKMFGKFKIKGNRAHLRSEEELVNVDKAEADDAFKKYKQTILDKYLAEKGFVKYKTNAYVRKNKIDVLEYIDLQKERYGSKTFTVNYAIMPLYVPHDYLALGFGDRLGTLICDKDIWWDYANDSIAQVSFQNVADAVERFVMPWFDKYAIEDILMKKLMEDKKKREQTGMGIPYKNEEWISSLKEDKARANIIGENIDRLKLPKKWNVPNSIPDIHLLDLSLK